MKSMTEKEYGIIKVKEPEFKQRKLLRVPHKQDDLIVSYPAFGPNFLKNNITEMQKSYSHPQTGERISFREPTTSESISAAAYDFGNLAKPQIFDPKWLQAGRIVRTSEGVFANPPKDAKGNIIIDEKTLKSYLNGVKPVKVGNGNIYIISDAENLKDFGFADYDSFERGIQDCDTFSQGGLARILEHTEEKEAKNLRKIASPKFYKREVNIYGFDNVREPVLRVVGLGSSRGLDDGRLGVSGGWYDDGGCAFGVLNKSAEGASQKNK